MKFLQCEPSCSMRADGQTQRQTDMMKLVVACRKFSNTLNKTQTSHSEVL